jgi:hypothetical protein
LLRALFGDAREPSKVLGRGRGNDDVDEQTDHDRTEDQVEDEERHWMILLNERPFEEHRGFFNREWILCIDLSQFLGKPIATSPEDALDEKVEIKMS